MPIKSASSKSTAVSSRRRAWKLVDTEACVGLVGRDAAMMSRVGRGEAWQGGREGGVAGGEVAALRGDAEGSKLGRERAAISLAKSQNATHF